MSDHKFLTRQAMADSQVPGLSLPYKGQSSPEVSPAHCPYTSRIPNMWDVTVIVFPRPLGSTTASLGPTRPQDPSLQAHHLHCPPPCCFVSDPSDSPTWLSSPSSIYHPGIACDLPSVLPFDSKCRERTGQRSSCHSPQRFLSPLRSCFQACSQNFGSRKLL